MRAPTLNSGTVLFVDDEPNVTEALRRAFRREPYATLTASSAAEALDVLAQNTVDVVISDERMPGMQGSVFLGQVRESYPDTVRILLSGQASLDDVLRAVNDGEIYRFFIKPFDATDLRVTIRRALEHKNLLQSSRQLLEQYRHQASRVQRRDAYIEQLHSANPDLERYDVDQDGAIVVSDIDPGADIQELLNEITSELNPSATFKRPDPVTRSSSHRTRDSDAAADSVSSIQLKRVN